MVLLIDLYNLLIKFFHHQVISFIIWKFEAKGPDHYLLCLKYGLAEETVFIGDSWSTDVTGAFNYGKTKAAKTIPHAK